MDVNTASDLLKIFFSEVNKIAYYYKIDLVWYLAPGFFTVILFFATRKWYISSPSEWMLNIVLRHRYFLMIFWSEYSGLASLFLCLWVIENDCLYITWCTSKKACNKF